MKKKIINWLNLFGLIQVLKSVKVFYFLPSLFIQYWKLRSQNKNNNLNYNLQFSFPVLKDKNEQSGLIDPHYFYQDLYVSKIIHKKKPKKHVDIGSRVDGLVSHLAIFRKVEVFDIRPLKISAENIEFRQVDFMTLNKKFENYCDSLSSLHAIEHFGLGRYGDSLDIDGHKKGFNNFFRMLRKGGFLYISFPIGPDRVEFNAHRVFSLSTIMNLIAQKYKLISFSYVDDTNNFRKNIKLSAEQIKTNLHCNYGCGIFELKKV